MLAAADSDHQWASQSGCDQHARKVAKHDRKTIGAFEPREGRSDGIAKQFMDIAGLWVRRLQLAEVQVDQVRDDFAVGVGLEPIALDFEFIFQQLVVFNDPVVNQGQDLIAAHVRVRIALRRRAVRGPASVADSRAAEGRLCVQGIRQRVDSANALGDRHVSS